MTERPSTYALDRALVAGDTPADDRIEKMREANREFLARFPDRQSLLSRGRPSRQPLLFAGVAAATAVAAVFALAPRDTIRTKGGGTAVEMFVERDGVAQRFTDQPLREGDTLVFRYSTEHRYLLGVGLEASGAVSSIIVGTDGKSVPIESGQQRVAPTGVRLDDYIGSERIFVLLSDSPLDARRVEQAITKAYESLPKAEVEALSIEPLSLEASVEQRSWLIRKQAR